MRSARHTTAPRDGRDLPAGADRRRHREAYVDNLQAGARRAAKAGRTLLIEPINPRDIPGYFLNTQAEAHAIRDEVGEPNLKVQMDFYHAQIVEGDLAMTFRTHVGGIGHVQIAGVPGRNEPDRGEVNYAYLFNLVDEVGYEGWVGCEYRPRGRTEDGLGWLTTWRQGRQPRMNIVITGGAGFLGRRLAETLLARGVCAARTAATRRSTDHARRRRAGRRTSPTPRRPDHWRHRRPSAARTRRSTPRPRPSSISPRS